MWAAVLLWFNLYGIEPCDCISNRKSSEVIAEVSPTIFTGLLQRRDKVDKGMVSADVDAKVYELLIFKVIWRLKEDLFAEDTLRIVNELTSCGATLEVGREYLVMPFKTNLFNTYRIHDCYAPTRPVSECTEWINALKKLLK